MSGNLSEELRALRQNPSNHNKLQAKNRTMEKKPEQLDVTGTGQAESKAANARKKRPRIQYNRTRVENETSVSREPKKPALADGVELSQEDIDDWLNMFKPLNARRDSPQSQLQSNKKSGRQSKPPKMKTNDRN